ncbi:hypothetical protein HOC80_00990 [archaeon]|jgi:hypothetical protein|nr:hypothetical protein [archaeon]MBT4416658.1 hypothetical protein [archaeon]
MGANPRVATTKDLPNNILLCFTKPEDIEMLKVAQTQCTTFRATLGKLKKPYEGTESDINKTLRAIEAFQSGGTIIAPSKIQILTDINKFSMAIGEMTREATKLVTELTKIHDKLQK